MASCPNCGFDLSEAGSCPVCGYGGAERAAPKRSARLWLIVASVVAVVALGGVAYMIVSRSEAGRGAPTANAASAAQEQGAAVAQAAVAPPSTQSPALKADAAPATSSQTTQESTASEATPAGGTRPAYDLVDHTSYPPIDTKEAYVKWMLANTKETEPYLTAKWNRAQIAIGRGDTNSRRVLMAFLLTPRERFVVHGDEPKAYADTAIPIGFGQTISGPHIVIRMTNALNPLPEEKVLEVGTGSGYQSAILSQLSNHVYTIEIVKPLSERTNALYEKMTPEFPMYQNIRRRNSDGYFGWPSDAPFERIIVTAAIDHIPPELIKELSPGGIMVIPVGPPTGQTVLKITKFVNPDGTIRLEREDIYHGQAKKTFVPFTDSSGGRHSLQRDGSGGQ